MITSIVVALVLLVPRAAWACATCVASAYGDRTFNWAFLGLILMPFLVGLGIAGVFVARHHALRSHSINPSSGGTAAAPLTHEESSL